MYSILLSHEFTLLFHLYEKNDHFMYQPIRTNNSWSIALFYLNIFIYFISLIACTLNMLIKDQKPRKSVMT